MKSNVMPHENYGDGNPSTPTNSKNEIYKTLYTNILPAVTGFSTSLLLYFKGATKT